MKSSPPVMIRHSVNLTHYSILKPLSRIGSKTTDGKAVFSQGVSLRYRRFHTSGHIISLGKIFGGTNKKLYSVVYFTPSTNFFMALGYLEQTKASRLSATGSPYHSMGRWVVSDIRGVGTCSRSGDPVPSYRSWCNFRLIIQLRHVEQ